MDPRKQLDLLAHIPGNVSFEEKIDRPLKAAGVNILQLNVGRQCNLTCRHCHVSAGPDRKESMGRQVFEKCLEILHQHPIDTVDITGGSPEMNPHLPWFIRQAAKLQRRMLVRSNLVILAEEAYRRYLDLYTDNGVEVVASLPDYHPERTDRQRGNGVFEKIITIMRALNDRGYGRPGSRLVLDLVYNPAGAYLPGSQKALTHEYKTKLSENYGVVFNDLFCLTNCPVGRYLEFLVRTDNYEDYMTELINAFNRSAVDSVMCRNTLSVAWDGKLYDCDFNQMLSMTVNHGAPAHIDTFNFNLMKKRQIVTANHCYACTAGAGSSCQGALDG